MLSVNNSLMVSMAGVSHGKHVYMYVILGIGAPLYLYGKVVEKKCFFFC